MANASNFVAPPGANLIGLWDFLDGSEKSDTGLADGTAQNLVKHGGYFPNGFYRTGSGDDHLHVRGDDTPFDLSEGSVMTLFAATAAPKPGEGYVTIASRGEHADAQDEGFFEVRLTAAGGVEVVHQDGSAVSLLGTGDGFAELSDRIKVTYSWDAEAGTSLLVENTTQGTSYTAESSVTGLTFALTDKDNESFTIAAEETDDGQYGHFFEGKIDYVAVLDAPILMPQPELDGIVEGTAGDDLIDVNYDGDPEGDRIDAGDAILPGEGPDDDIVDAGAGNDTVLAGEGDDTVYAGAGDDHVEGGAGNDTIYGDSALAGPDSGPGPNLIVNGSFEDTWGLSQTGYGWVGTGGVPNWTASDPHQQVDLHSDGRGGVAPTDGHNWLDLEASPGNVRIGQTVQGIEAGETYELSFDAGDDASKASSGPGENLVKVYWGGELVATIDPVQGGMSHYQFTVTGGAGDGSNRLEFEGTGTADNVGASIDSVELRATTGAPVAGNDTLLGGVGDDVIFGEGGNDIIRGGSGNDTLDGGAGHDTIDGGSGDDTILGGDGDDRITGGSGSDTVEGGAGNDIIDTGGTNAGNLPDRGFPSYDGLPAVPVDPDPYDDRDTVYGGDGDDIILTGDDEDTIFGGSGNDRIDAGLDDDWIDGGEGSDHIIGGEGSDLIYGGDGDDRIWGGLGESRPDAFNIRDDGSDGPADPVTDNGMDVIHGGAGNDKIYGQDDDDTLFGDEGDDLLDGGIDDDTLYGGDGSDKLIGGQGNDLLDGGADADEMFGGDDRDTFVNVTAGDYIDGGEGFSLTPDDDYDTLDLRGSAENENPGGTLRVDYDPSNAENGTVTYFDQDGAATGTVEFYNIENVIPCFTPGTRIATPTGERLVETLEAGDLVMTRDNGLQEIRWIGRHRLPVEHLRAAPHLRPVLIRKHALGHGLPERDMMVSPNHRVLIVNDRTELYFEESEVLVAAKHLTSMPGIDVAEVEEVTYIHFMFDQHEVVLSDGAWTESFQPGDLSLDGIGAEQAREIYELFPELRSREGLAAYHAARRSLKRHEAMLVV